MTAVAVAALLSGCAAVGPDYARPPLDLPLAYKENAGWKPATPQLIDASQPWWEVYHDATLNALMAQANRANQNIQQSEAVYREAQAIAAAARANFFPTLGANAGATRARTNSSGAVKLGDDYSLGLSASWEPDVWGSVRRAVEAGDAGTQASAADLAGARLSIQSTLAQDYMQVRALDLQKKLYAASIDAYAKSLALTQHQYAAGVVLRSDVALAQSQLAQAQAQAVDLQAQRTQLEHAIAVLTGQSPSRFTLAALDDQGTAQMAVPVVPPGLPSTLLERRPDIAGAEQRMRAANANIGVAQAAFYPQIMLSASGGFSSATIGALFNTPSRIFSLGAALAQTIFDGGLRRAHSDQAIATYDASVAQYKQTVLAGFQQVEDNLATLRLLDEEAAYQAKAVEASQLSERLALSQYRAGTATYLGVVTAQNLSLTNQRTAAQLRGRQLVASVALIAATGGGWNATDLATSSPSSSSTASKTPARAGS
ncbi:RND transporter [Rhodoferax koreense]|uniref:RND transporter n=1 Tax=Rhodoferax koreensis TaxID=1842727 RepID=A0A1P8K2I0_9BURK|nr:efflux transporter outer membrane subunit [Rhodoferax koreense]APW40212.1 RND transporter [Rhodoferax koreense]